MAPLAMSDNSFALNSVLRMPYIQEELSDSSVDGISLPDFTSDFFTPLESWDSPAPASKMQNQSRQLPNADIWSWSNQQPRDMIYSNLDIDASGFDFPNIETSYSLFQDRDTWSGASSPISKPTTPKDTYAPSISLRGSSTSSPSLPKPKANKGERLEKRREKNRTSQRRYRERKEKYIHDLENQCKRLRERNDALSARLVQAGGEIFPHEEIPVVYEEKPEWQRLEADLDSVDGETEFNYSAEGRPSL